VIEVDGSRGEGGGQILRTSLALSMITGQPLRMTNIRAGRAKPGLRKQHVACVEAAAAVSRARVDGARVASQVLEFEPARRWEPHDLEIDIGSAGSATLVVQTVLVPVLLADKAWRGVIKGGTHNPMAPPAHFLERAFLPQLVAMGAKAEIRCEREGFVPTGGGKLVVEIEGGSQLRGIELVASDAPVTARRATSIVTQIPIHVAERELAKIRDELGWSEAECAAIELQRGGPANIVMLEVERAGVRELVAHHGEKHTRAEVIARRACDDLRAYLAHGHPVGEHLADQLLLPMALAKGASKFRSGALSLHATTNIDTIHQFRDVAISVADIERGVEVSVG